MRETAKKTFNQTEWVYDCSWWQRALKDFSQRVFANLRDSPGVASRWSQVGVFANLSGTARNPRTPLYYANTAKLLNKYNHSNTQLLPSYLTNTTTLLTQILEVFQNIQPSWKFLQYMWKVCHFWGQQWHSEVKSKFTTTSMWQISPWKSFSKIVSVFPLVPFCQTNFFLLFSRGGRFSWGVELRNATSDANRASTTFLQQPNGSESWDFRQLKKKFEFEFEFWIEIKLGFHCTLYNN